MAGHPTTESLATDFRDLVRELAASRAEFAAFREDFAGFRGRVETQIGFPRWLGAFSAAILVTLVGSTLWLSWNASALSQRVEILQGSTANIVGRLNRLDRSDGPPSEGRPGAP